MMASDDFGRANGGPTSTPDLPTVRRLEAAGFRAWPTGRTHYDGTWAIRIASHHGAKRLNSINPLDPADIADIDGRIVRADAFFALAGRVPTFRLSPLAGAAIDARLDALGWLRLGQSMVMTMPLNGNLVDGALDQIALRDKRRFVAASLKVRGAGSNGQAGLVKVIASIEPEVGLFVIESEGRPVACALCVQDGDVAGLFEIATAKNARRRGFGQRIVLSALKWARSRGARIGWLQVEADNAAALSLYRRIGFSSVYDYHYRQVRQS